MIRNLLFATAFFAGFTVNAQLVAGSAYMQGNHVEVGIDSLHGYEGINTITAPVPSGMHQRGPVNLFGFVANPQMDGWVNFDGDYYTPGSPENGWGIEFIDTTTVDTFNVKLSNNCAFSGSGIDGSIISYTYAAGIKTVLWHGNYSDSTRGYDLDFDITYTLGDVDLYYTTSMTIFNNGPANIEHLYYFRNIDPDNNQSIASDFTTTNTIISQPTVSSPVAAVKAEQYLPWSSTFAFFTADTNARVSVGGFSNRDGSDIWNGIMGLVGTTGYVNTADEAVSLAFYQPGLVSFTRSGTSSVNFTFQTVFDSLSLVHLLNTVGVNEISIEGLNVYPNPANNLLNVTSNESLKGLTLYNGLGTVVYKNTNVNTNNTQIDMSSLNAGFYFLSIEGANGKVVKKIMKQ